MIEAQPHGPELPSLDTAGRSTMIASAGQKSSLDQAFVRKTKEARLNPTVAAPTNRAYAGVS